jgi:hypothetical protein
MTLCNVMGWRNCFSVEYGGSIFLFYVVILGD